MGRQKMTAFTYLAVRIRFGAVTLRNNSPGKPLPVGRFYNWSKGAFDNIYTIMLKYMVPWQAGKFNTRARRAGLEEVTVLNFHIEPNFAKKDYRTLLAILSLLVLARAYRCLLMTGDANAAAYRLYSSTRADQRGGARPDPKNCTQEIACRLFQNAYNKGTAIRNRMMLSVIHTCTSYSLASAHMKSWLNNSCTKVLDHINDTIVMVVFDNARNHTHMDQRIAQTKCQVASTKFRLL